jgi:predicted Zn-dependent protease
MPTPAVTKLFAVLCACVILAGCATSTRDGLSQSLVPAPLSAVYSDVNMQLKLVAIADDRNRCTGPGWSASGSIEKRVARIGPDLAAAAFQLYPELGSRIERFDFIIADKAEPGTVSNSSGRIVILRPVDGLAPTDTALAFVMAREIGHVVAMHHDENTAASLIVSGLAQIFLPVANVARLISKLFLSGSAVVGSSATTAAGASVTATSFVGSRVVITAYRPKQRDEADQIAMNLLARLGYDALAVATAFDKVDRKSPATEWMSHLWASVDRLAAPSLLPPAILPQATASAQ